MFERFTDRARRVVVLAQEEARLLDHNYIGPEHILLGLIHEGTGIAARALEGLGLSLDAARQQTEERAGRGKEAQSGHIPFTPKAKRMLELSLREALILGHNYIGTEHILLGILREGDNVATEVLVGMGTDLNQVRQEVMKLVRAGEAGEGTPGAAGPVAAARTPRAAVSLDFVLGELRDTLAGIAERLTAIERHLGMTVGAREAGGPPDDEAAGPGGGQPAPPGDGPGDGPGEPPGDVSAHGE
jgi:ATP-dependent Clp protease ATP-binding subunit ClpC